MFSKVTLGSNKIKNIMKCKCIELISTFIGCNIWINSFKFNRIIYNLSGIMQLCEFILTIHSLVKNCLTIFSIKFCRNQYRIKFDIFLDTPFPFSRILPLIGQILVESNRLIEKGPSC